MTKKLITLIACALIIGTVMSCTKKADPEMEALKAQMQAMQAELDKAKSGNAAGEQAANSSSPRYLFEQNFKENNISVVSYWDEWGNLHSYIPNIGFTVGKRVIYDGFIPLLDCIIPDSALAVLNQEELRLLRNTIYAKYGMIFQSSDLRAHFQQFNWYRPVNSNVEARLTEVDKKNITNMQIFENARPNPNLNKRELVRSWNEYFPVPSWSPEITINDDNTIEYMGKEGYFKGRYRIENGFLVVFVTEQSVGTPDYLLNSSWRWPSDVTYSDGTVTYKEPIKMVFPVEDATRFVYRDDWSDYSSTNQSRQIGSIVWFSWVN